MPKPTLLETDTVTLEQLMSNGNAYRVPAYQRDYSWEKEQWEDLWLDIVEGAGTDLPHYMGAIVLQRLRDHYQVIDGQQRLATLTTLCVALLERLNSSGLEDDKHRASLLKTQYVGADDPSSLRWASKLSLNDSDDRFFQEFIINSRTPPATAKLPDSNRRLLGARDFFREKLGTLKEAADGASLVRFFVERIGKHLTFTRIIVEDELNAYAVFETLNARLVQLTATDLLKNYLFSLFRGGTVDLDQAKGQWARILRTVEPEDVPQFLRHFLASRQSPVVRVERLFKELKLLVRTREHAFSLLDDLERAAGWYAALDDPYDPFWSGGFADCKAEVRAVGLFQVSQYKPLLLACFAKAMNPQDIQRVLRACKVVSFRFNIIGRRNPNELEAGYNLAAMAVLQAGAPTSRTAIDALKPHYVADDDFVSDFTRAAFPTKGRRAKLAKYILMELEHQAGGPAEDFETAPTTLEHVLPERLSDAWRPAFDEELHTNFVDKLGNYALLERDRNNDLGNAGYAQKRAVYRQSKFELTRAITAEEWTPAAIQQRQAGLAKMAKTVWQVDF